MASMVLPNWLGSTSFGPLESFNKLSPSVYFHAGEAEVEATTTVTTHQCNINSKPSTRRDQQHDTPNVILLFTWMGAEPKHIAKYISKYIELFPTASIILIRTHLFDIIFLPPIVLKRRYEPALAKILSLNQTSKKNHTEPRVLVKAFSNGGAFAFLHFAGFYYSLTGSVIPINAIIFDSGPAIGDLARGVAAIMAVVPRNPVLWYPVVFLLNIFLRLLWARDTVLRRKSVVRRTYFGLNEPRLLPNGVPRLYLYSKADTMVDWREVEAHARNAEENGASGKTELVKFEKSEHVAHVREDAEKYWDAVRMCWKSRKSLNMNGAGK